MKINRLNFIPVLNNKTDIHKSVGTNFSDNKESKPNYISYMNINWPKPISFSGSAGSCYDNVDIDEQIDVADLIQELEKGKMFGGILVKSRDYVKEGEHLIQYSAPGNKFDGKYAMANLECRDGKVYCINRNIPAERLAAIFAIYGNDEVPHLAELKKYLNLPEATDEMINQEKKLEEEKAEKEEKKEVKKEETPPDVSIKPEIDATDLIKELEKGKMFGSILVESREHVKKGEHLIQYSIPGKEFKDGIHAMVNFKCRNGKIYGVSRNISADSLAANLRVYGNDELPLLAELKKYLSLPEATDEMISREKAEDQQRLIRINRLNSIKSEKGRWIKDASGKLVRTSKLREKINDIKEASSIAQGEYDISKPESGFRYLKTHIVWPCIGLTLYDPKSKVGLLAHIDSGKKIVASMPEMLINLEKSGANINKLQARVIGGHPGTSLEIISDIYDTLARNGIPIEEKDILDETANNSVMLDLESGIAYSYKPKFRDDSVERNSYSRYVDSMIFKSADNGISSFMDTYEKELNLE